MAVLLSASSKQKRGQYRPLAEINVTPLVDVILVLLIVFMVTAPLLTVGVTVDLPQTQAQAVPGSDEPIVVTLTREDQIYLQETLISPETLEARLRAIAERTPDLRVFVRGDSGVSYGTVMEAIGRINAAGFSKVALLTDPAASS